MCDGKDKDNTAIANEIGRNFALAVFRYLWLPESSRHAFVEGARAYMSGYPELERRAVEDTICALQQANGERVCLLQSAGPVATEDANPFAPGTFPEDEVLTI